MRKFETKHLPSTHDDIAPDGSKVRALLQLASGSMAHFEFPPGETSFPVAHRTVEEIWFFLSGSGEFWRKLEDQEDVDSVEPGVSITIPVGTHFQIRSFEGDSLTAVGVTMPPWPGEDESYDIAGNADWSTTISR